MQVHWLILDGSRHKLLVLTGQSSEDSGDLLLHTGQFSPHDFVQIFADEEVGLFKPFNAFVLMFCECIKTVVLMSTFTLSGAWFL